VLEVSREVWRLHEHNLRASGDLFYVWQYELRWAAFKTRAGRAGTHGPRRVFSVEAGRRVGLLLAGERPTDNFDQLLRRSPVELNGLAHLGPGRSDVGAEGAELKQVVLSVTDHAVLAINFGRMGSSFPDALLEASYSCHGQE